MWLPLFGHKIHLATTQQMLNLYTQNKLLLNINNSIRFIDGCQLIKKRDMTKKLQWHARV